MGIEHMLYKLLYSLAKAKKIQCKFEFNKSDLISYRRMICIIIQVANFVKRLLKASLIAALKGLLSLGNA